MLGNITQAGRYASGHVVPLDNVRKLSYLQRMEVDIRDVAAECSNLAHHAIRLSLTGEMGIEPTGDSFKKEMCNGMRIEEIEHYFLGINRRISGMRKALFTNLEKKLLDGVHPDCAVAQAYAEHLIWSIQSNTGNCAEKSLLAGIFLKAMMKTMLRQQGYTNVEIERAKLSISIASNRNRGGDHQVCLLNYDIDGKKTLIVDPWLHGIVYEQEDAADLYQLKLERPDEPFIFDTFDEYKTQVINHDECVTIVMRFAADVFGENLEFLRGTEGSLSSRPVSK